MEVARAVENEGHEARREFAIELFDQWWWRGETQSRPPVAGIERRQVQRFISPRVVEIKMQGVAQKIIWARAIGSGYRFV